MTIWYAAHLILVVVFKDDNQDHYPVWENIHLIEASTADKAFEKAEAIGKEGEGDAGGTFQWMGRPAAWKFAGVRKLSLCQDAGQRPGDGTEITYLQFKIKSKADLDRLLDSVETAVALDEEFECNQPSESARSEPI